VGTGPAGHMADEQPSVRIPLYDDRVGPHHIEDSRFLPSRPLAPQGRFGPAGPFRVPVPPSFQLRA
jgi:hypothetical protein